MKAHISLGDCKDADKAYELLLSHTAQVSARASFGWLLLDKSGSRLTHGSLMAGTDIERLSLVINSFSEQLHHLYLTSEPQIGAVDTRSIISAIEDSSCLLITIAHRYPAEQKDLEWQTWSENWPGELRFFTPSYVASKLVSGIAKVRHSYTPWLVAICANSFQNQPVALADLKNEFGVISHLSEQVRQCRAVLYNPSQRDIIDTLPRHNHMDELVEFFEVESLGAVKAILRYCASSFRCNAIIFCDNGLLAELVQADLPDEILHHAVLSDLHALKTTNAEQFPELHEWDISSSATLGNCNRITFKKKTMSSPIPIYAKSISN